MWWCMKSFIMFCYFLYIYNIYLLSFFITILLDKNFQSVHMNIQPNQIQSLFSFLYYILDIQSFSFNLFFPFCIHLSNIHFITSSSWSLPHPEHFSMFSLICFLDNSSSFTPSPHPAENELYNTEPLVHKSTSGNRSFIILT